MTQKVVSFDYILKDQEGTILDDSKDSSPLQFLAGTGMLIPQLEKEVLAMNIGDSKEVQVNAADAYGEIREDMVIKVLRSQFPADADLNLGDHFRVNQDENMPPFLVTAIEGEEITLNGNHPLAGKDLSFSVTIVESRDATEDEIAHGHVHGAGCSHH